MCGSNIFETAPGLLGGKQKSTVSNSSNFLETATDFMKNSKTPDDQVLLQDFITSQATDDVDETNREIATSTKELGSVEGDFLGI